MTTVDGTQAQPLPTVSELAAMSDAELVERHDAQVARTRATGEAVSDIYLGELGRRMVELRYERVIRLLIAALALSSTALIFIVAALVVAL
jgi:hypothetical protein